MDTMLRRAITPAVALAALGSLLSCGTGNFGIHRCSDSCEAADSTNCGQACECSDRCAQSSHDGWIGPALVWAGSGPSAPECPDEAPQIAYEGDADLVAPNHCGPCECEPASCVFPKTLTASPADCGRDDVTLTPIQAPDPYSDACVQIEPLSARSITIPPPTVNPCTPVVGAAQQAPEPKAPPQWKTHARACMASAEACHDPSGLCPVSVAEPPAGFSQCIFSRSDTGRACPDEYPVKHVFYSGFKDERACTECTCGRPVGLECEVTYEWFADAVCSDDRSVAGNTNGAGWRPVCTQFGLPWGPLRSIRVPYRSAKPGICEPDGGAPTGEATPEDPALFCCQR